MARDWSPDTTVSNLQKFVNRDPRWIFHKKVKEKEKNYRCIVSTRSSVSYLMLGRSNVEMKEGSGGEEEAWKGGLIFPSARLRSINIIFRKRDIRGDSLSLPPSSTVQDFKKYNLFVFDRRISRISTLSLSLSLCLREEEISREDTRWRDKFRNDPEKQKRKRIGSDLVKLDNCCSGFFAKKPSLELVLWLRYKRFPA